MPADGSLAAHPPQLHVSLQGAVQAPWPGSSKSVDSLAAVMRSRYAHGRSSYSTSVAFSESCQATEDRDEVLSGTLVRLPPSATLHRPPLPDARRELQPAPASARPRAAARPAQPFGPVSMREAEEAGCNLSAGRSPRDSGESMWGSHLVPSIASAESGALPDTLKPPGGRGSDAGSDAASKRHSAPSHVLDLQRQPEDEQIRVPPTAAGEAGAGSNPGAAFEFEFELARTISVSDTLASVAENPLATLWSTAMSSRSDVGVPPRTATPSGKHPYAVKRSAKSVNSLSKVGSPLSPGLSVAPRARSADSASLHGRRQSSSTQRQLQSTRLILQAQQELKQSLHEDDMQICSVLDRGGFGTVYRGAPTKTLFLLYFVQLHLPLFFQRDCTAPEAVACSHSRVFEQAHGGVWRWRSRRCCSSARGPTRTPRGRLPSRHACFTATSWPRSTLTCVPSAARPPRSWTSASCTSCRCAPCPPLLAPCSAVATSGMRHTVPQNSSLTGTLLTYSASATGTRVQWCRVNIK